MENHFNCIYCYTNKINGKKYVGQTVDFNKRHKEHINSSYDQNRKYHYNMPFHNAIRKYNINNFTVEILKENLKTQCLLNFYECYYIEKFNTLARNGEGYNIASGGSNGNNFAGKTEEEMKEIKRKMSEARKGNQNAKRLLIARYTKDSELVDIKYQFEYIQLGFDGGHISACCKWYACEDLDEWYKTHKNHPLKSTGGYIFKYHEE